MSFAAIVALWIGTWAAAAQHWTPGRLQNFSDQTVRLIVHVSAGGRRARIRVSNTYGDQPLHIGAAHIARRSTGAAIDPASDRRLTFGGQGETTIAPHAMAVSDPADIDIAPRSDLSISLFFPDITLATTVHALASQTNYVATQHGDATAAADLLSPKTIASWPFLTGVDVEASSSGAAIVALGSSLTDGDGSSKDSNHRWPDAFAERLQQKCGSRELGVLNEGIIGNRLMSDIHTPRQTGGPFTAVYEDLGPALGDAGVARFDRDVLDQPGAKYVFLALGVNDILFPGSFISANERVSAKSLIEANRQLLKRGHARGLRVIITTIPPFQGAVFRGPTIEFFTPEKEKVRQEVNAWIRGTKEFDGTVDFDAPVRDPSDPARLLPEYDSGDHVHPNDAGYVATANAIPLDLFGCE